MNNLIPMPCPFCGGESELTENTEAAPNEYCLNRTIVFVQCNACESRSKGIHQKPFCDMSEYTAQDFRDNKDLRPVVESIHEDHKKECAIEAINLWNSRSVNLEPLIYYVSKIDDQGSAYTDLCSANYKLNKQVKKNE